ncbi:unnamed protein product [Amoebophrya sp. A25]|nr:unnamed protein product [Amoebophrya sp. A25]|eukprot:GSA25T00023131001.1
MRVLDVGTKNTIWLWFLHIAVLAVMASTSTTPETKGRPANVSEFLQSTLAKAFPSGVTRATIVKYLILVNVATFVLFAFDKVAAYVCGRWCCGKNRKTSTSKESLGRLQKLLDKLLFEETAYMRRFTIRVAESVLLTCALIGGSPAMLIGITLLRHKSKKQTFLFQFYLILFIHCVSLALFIWRKEEALELAGKAGVKIKGEKVSGTLQGGGAKSTRTLSEL